MLIGKVKDVLDSCTINHNQLYPWATWQIQAIIVTCPRANFEGVYLNSYILFFPGTLLGCSFSMSAFPQIIKMACHQKEFRRYFQAT